MRNCIAKTQIPVEKINEMAKKAGMRGINRLALKRLGAKTRIPGKRDKRNTMDVEN